MRLYMHARTVREDPQVEKIIDDATKKNPRVSDAFEALKWLLARRCDKLPPIEIGGSDPEDEKYYLYRQAGDPQAGTPSILVLYVYTDDTVDIKGVNIDPEPELWD